MWQKLQANKALYELVYTLQKDTVCPNHPNDPSCKKKLNQENDKIARKVMKEVILGKDTAKEACKTMKNAGACDKKRYQCGMSNLSEVFIF